MDEEITSVRDDELFSCLTAEAAFKMAQNILTTATAQIDNARAFNDYFNLDELQCIYHSALAGIAGVANEYLKGRQK